MEVLAADSAVMTIWVEILTGASTGALAGNRLEVRWAESADGDGYVWGFPGGFDGSFVGEPDGDSPEGVGG